MRVVTRRNTSARVLRSVRLAVQLSEQSLVLPVEVALLYPWQHPSASPSSLLQLNGIIAILKITNFSTYFLVDAIIKAEVWREWTAAKCAKPVRSEECRELHTGVPYDHIMKTIFVRTYL